MIPHPQPGLELKGSLVESRHRFGDPHYLWSERRLGSRGSREALFKQRWSISWPSANHEDYRPVRRRFARDLGERFGHSLEIRVSKSYVEVPQRSRLDVVGPRDPGPGEHDPLEPLREDPAGESLHGIAKA